MFATGTTTPGGSSSRQLSLLNFLPDTSYQVQARKKEQDKSDLRTYQDAMGETENNKEKASAKVIARDKLDKPEDLLAALSMLSATSNAIVTFDPQAELFDDGTLVHAGKHPRHFHFSLPPLTFTSPPSSGGPRLGPHHHGGIQTPP